MASINAADRLAYQVLPANCKSDTAVPVTALGNGDSKQFFNAGTEILYLRAPSSNTGSVTVALTAISAFDSARTVNKTVVLAANGRALCSNLNPLNMGQVVSITVTATGSDVVNASFIIPAVQ